MVKSVKIKISKYSRIKYLNLKIFKYYIFLAIIFWLLIIIPREADASAIINRPLAIGLTQGLMAYWTFDGRGMSEATALDSSGNNNTANFYLTPSKTMGKIGQGIAFSGGSCLTTANSDTLNSANALTIAAWIYRTKDLTDMIV